MIWTLLIVFLIVIIYRGFKECDNEFDEFKASLKEGDCFKKIDDENNIFIATILKINKEYDIVTYKVEYGGYNRGREILSGKGYFADKKTGDFCIYIKMLNYKKVN